MASVKRKKFRIAAHRPARRRRVFRHDSLTACDLFSGFGGLTKGIEDAGFDTIMAANHNEYKVRVHETNHPTAEHWIADLVDPDASDYHSARDLPPADLLAAGVSCFAAGALVLTRRGLIPIEDVKVGEEVWTHRSRWRPVTHTSAVDRPTVTVNATTAITCTPDHPFMAATATRAVQPRRRYQPLDGARCLECGGPAPQFRNTSTARLFCSRKCSQANANRRALLVLGAPREVRADSLAGEWVGTPILTGETDALPVVDGLGTVTADVAWVLGRWVGDGWLARRPERGNVWSRVTICASHDESDALAEELAARTGLPWNRTRQRTTDTFHVNRVGLAAFLADHFGHGAAGKKLPTWLLFAPEEIRRSFLDGYLSADGHISRDGLRVQSMSVSKQLTVGVRLLLTSLGYYATVHYQRPKATAVIEGRTVRQSPRWTVTAHLTQQRKPKHRDADGFRWGKASGAIAPGETVTVYNMTVEEDHTYVVDGVLVHNCVNHSQANTQRAYEQGLGLFELEDPEFEARVTRSERDRATATCVLQYAGRHHPRLILVECTTGLQSWGPAILGRPKIGDGSTYRWWLHEFEKLGYRYRVLYLNSQFFGVPQSRDRLYIAFWDESLPTPDLDHRPASFCQHCDKTVEAVWSWKTGVPASGSVCYGKQYNYRCPSCRREVVPPMTPSLVALDLSDLGTKIGDRDVPLAETTLARAERCRQRFAQYPAVLMPAKSVHGIERHPWQPMSTQTSQQETALLMAGQIIAAHRHNGDGQHILSPMDTVTATHEKAVFLAVDNYQGGPRGAHIPLPTQVGSETLAVVSSGIVPFRKNTLPTVHAEAMPTVTSDQIPGLLSAGWFKQNGPKGDETAPHPVTDPLGTLTTRDTTGLLVAQWQASLADLPLEECFFRMMKPSEVGVGCGFDVDFAGRKGTFKVWGSARNQVDGFGNAVSPAVGTWIASRLRAVIHGELVAA
ncbi:DNA cytosine methyltransferase [Streptomyces longwoodensis]|uniref:DNA cytosine methyltransferase n=1 Tax=Streptomyces longwoodensis TaxID=68231 RepID=UPI000A46444B|nr:DNA cytosine methyltransferase [Streptomyces longwoodensis]